MEVRQREKGVKELMRMIAAWFKEATLLRRSRGEAVGWLHHPRWYPDGQIRLQDRGTGNRDPPVKLPRNHL